MSILLDGKLPSVYSVIVMRKKEMTKKEKTLRREIESLLRVTAGGKVGHKERMVALRKLDLRRRKLIALTEGRES
jgi:hypothetical protein